MQNYYNTKRLESQAKNTRDYDTHCLFCQSSSSNNENKKIF